MQAFGDVSGHLKSVLSKEDPYCVVGVVIGGKIPAGRCAKKTVRNISDIKEAKWRDLLPKQKRRFLERLREEEELSFGCAIYDRRSLMGLECYHHLFEDVCFPPDWDIALKGYAYGEILFEHGCDQEQYRPFELDRVASTEQSRAIVHHVRAFVPDIQPSIRASHDSAPIQTADCIAGAIRETKMERGEDWSRLLGDLDLSRCGSAALAQLENDLHRYDRTGP